MYAETLRRRRRQRPSPIRSTNPQIERHHASRLPQLLHLLHLRRRLPAEPRIDLSPLTAAETWKAEIIISNGEFHRISAKTSARRMADAERTRTTRGIAAASRR